MQVNGGRSNVMCSRFARATCGLLALLGIAHALFAQENDKTAIVAIQVTDISGAAVEGAELRFVEQATENRVVKRTDKTGRAVAGLKPGNYELTVTGSGFKRTVIRYVEANPSAHKQLEISLEALASVSDCCVDPVEPLIEPEHVEPRDTEIREQFVLEIISDGKLCPPQHLNCKDRGIWWKNFTLRASDGHRLYLVSTPFPTAKRAQKEFQKHVKRAQKILRREPEPNSEGEIVGERALGSFEAISGAHALCVDYYSLFWTWGKNHWELIGEHLEDVLALERRLKDEGTNAVWTWH